MNVIDQEDARNAEAYNVYNVAEAYQGPFTLPQLWEDLGRRVNYGRLAAMLMRWWREGRLEKQDGSGRWHKGFLNSDPPLPKSHKATYRFPVGTDGDETAPILNHRRFQLLRHTDVTGVSGTGVVAEGVLFTSGVVALQWTSEFPTSVVFHHRGMESVEAVHGHGGATEIRWLD